MRTMAAGEFKAKCLAVMDEVQATGEPVLITKRGKPVARVVPSEQQVAQEPPEAIFGCLKHLLAHPEQGVDLGDPIIRLGEWDHLRDDWPGFTGA